MKTHESFKEHIGLGHWISHVVQERREIMEGRSVVGYGYGTAEAGRPGGGNGGLKKKNPILTDNMLTLNALKL